MRHRPDDVATVAAALVAGARRRVVAPGGMGKTRLLDRVAEMLGPARVAHWNAVVDPDVIPTDDRVLLADDVHAASRDGLHRLARRRGPVLAAHRPVAGQAGELLATVDGTPLALDPLTGDQVAALVARYQDGPAEPAAVERVLTASGGIPRHAVAIAHGCVPADGARATREIVEAERRRLDHAARALLTAAATLDGADLTLLAEACGVSTDAAAAAAAALVGAGLALDPLPLLVPVVAEAVRRSTPAAARSAVAELAAQAVWREGHDVVAFAERVRDVPRPGPQTCRCLLRAAELLLTSTHEAGPRGAATVVQRAGSLVDAAARGAAAPPDLAAARVLTSVRQGDVMSAMAEVDTLLQTAPDRRDATLHHAAIGLGAATLARRGAWWRSAELAEHALPSGGSVASAVLARVATGDVAGARRALRIYDAAPPTGLRSASAAAFARGLVATCDDTVAALPTLLDAVHLSELSPPWLGPAETPHAVAAVVACHAWEFDVAAQILADTPGRWRADPRHTLLSAWVALRRGDWVGALAAVRRVRAGRRRLDSRDVVVAAAVQAGVARRRGDLAALADAWRLARGTLLVWVPDLFVSQPVGELLIAGARLEDRGTVRSCLSAVGDTLARAGHPALWTLPLRFDEVHIAIANGDIAGARAAAKRAGALPQTSQRAGAVAAAARCWTDVIAGQVEPARVRTAARGLADAGLAWEAGRLAGAAAIRTTDRDTMRRLLRLARSLTTEQALALVHATGQLSPRERDVAGHLLAGLTHREIGAQLYISPKTVEHHVASIRRKLGVRSRAELLMALRHHLDTSDG